MFSYTSLEQDDRFTIAHLNYAAVQRLGTDEDDFATDLPDEGKLSSLPFVKALVSSSYVDIDVPLHLLPRYQDEDDESEFPPNDQLDASKGVLKASYLPLPILPTHSVTLTALLQKIKPGTHSPPPAHSRPTYPP